MINWLKNLIIEPYDPLYCSLNDRLMRTSKKLNGSFVFGFVASLIMIMLAMLFSPWWLIGIPALVVFAGFCCEQPLLRKRVQIGPPFSYWDDRQAGWYSIKLLDENEMYRQQVLDYFDHIRSGGLMNHAIEQELKEWVDLDTKYSEQIKRQQMRQDSENLSRRGQIEEYKNMLERQQ